MFAYCNNSPTVHKDNSGGALETVWDIISLSASVVEVCLNPTDVWAWVGLAGDIADVAIPFVGGIGETVKLLKTTEKIAETADAIDDAYDAAKVIDKVEGMCFVAGTLVSSNAGSIPIETIIPGDYVWAWDENTGDVRLKRVIETYINKTTELIHLHVNSEVIITTPTHPFYSPVKGWTDAVHLRAGDVLVTVNGEYVVVEKVQHEILEAPITVYNFQVEDYHTYYVGTLGVLVHNSCHANSLKTTKKTDLYALKDNTTGAVKKIGETTRGTKRYTKKFYSKNNVHMQIIDSGSKRAMHYQQHRILVKYKGRFQKLPLLNKSLW